MHGLLYRQFAYKKQYADQFIDVASKLHPDTIVISGDLTTTAHPKELELSLAFIKKLQTFTKVYCIPGNHDAYLLDSKPLWYAHLQKAGVDYTALYQKGSQVVPLDKSNVLLLVDNAIPTPFFFSNGRITQQQRLNIQKHLEQIPSTTTIILANHFPYHCNNPRKDLKGKELYASLFAQFPNIKLYLSGHLHHQKVDATKQPYQLDAGSLTEEKGGFFSIDLAKEGIKVTGFKRKNQTWEPATSNLF